MRRIAKVDSNHGLIREALRSMHIAVHDCSRYGGGFPDLLCSFGGYAMLVEVKSGNNGLTDDQEAFAGEYQGALSIVRDMQGAETVARFMRSMAKRLKHD